MANIGFQQKLRAKIVRYRSISYIELRNNFKKCNHTHTCISIYIYTYICIYIYIYTLLYIIQRHTVQVLGIMIPNYPSSLVAYCQADYPGGPVACSLFSSLRALSTGSSRGASCIPIQSYV